MSRAEGANTYGEMGYWDKRYEATADGNSYDWYMGWKRLKKTIVEKLSGASEGKVDAASVHTLMVGCGNSEMSADMYEDGFTSIMSFDYSEVVIRKMKEKHGDATPGMEFEVADARDLRYDSASFDLVVDKGTLDAILCGGNSGSNSKAMLSEVARVLKPGGVFVIITYGEPDSRLEHLESPRYGWTVEHELVGAKRQHFYTMTKKGSSSSA
jgi:ubiquinone/menaquinone biosynthesis C-methylase UbiE